MNERLAAAWALAPDYLGQHVLLSALALALGAAISLPAAVAAARAPGLRAMALGLAGLVQTIPSLALLALFYPVLLALSGAVLHFSGIRISAFGFLPALLALTLYAVLPILRNTLVGLAQVDGDMRDAARAVGMTERQSLVQVELPLAAPMILAGVRTSAVWVIGAATLATPIGQTSLGNFIFTGLQTENWVFVVFGCVAASAVALWADRSMALIEEGLARRTRWRVTAGAGLLGVGLLAALAPALAGAGPGRAPVVIGAKTFTEQYILAELIEGRLAGAGLGTSVRAGLGSAVILRALAAGDIDVYVDYSGTIWTTAMGRTDNPGRAAVNEGTARWLMDTYGVVSLGSLGFENAYALAMRGDAAEDLGVRTIADLAPHAADLKIGGDYEFFERPEWAAVEAAYGGLAFAAERQYQSTFLYRAVAQGEVDVISAFSSDGRVSALDLQVLEDPKGALPPYDAILLISPKRANDAALLKALRPLIGAVSIEAMRAANARVDVAAEATPAEAAADLDRAIKDRR